MSLVLYLWTYTCLSHQTESSINQQIKKGNHEWAVPGKLGGKSTHTQKNPLLNTNQGNGSSKYSILGMSFIWLAVPLLKTLMIRGCVNDCSHGFVALRNWNSDPTVIHGCLHSNRLVPTETMGKEGQGLKETLTEKYLYKTKT